MTRTLDVWCDGRLVGRLTRDAHGDLGFVYCPDWHREADAPALSISLPKREEPFSRRECRPFFGDLLPEEGQRDTVAQALGVSRANEFALLDRQGRTRAVRLLCEKWASRALTTAHRRGQTAMPEKVQAFDQSHVWLALLPKKTTAMSI